MTISTVFILLFFISIPLFLMGMLRPSMFKFLTQGVSSRKKLSLIMLSISLISFVLALATAPRVDTKNSDESKIVDTNDDNIVEEQTDTADKKYLPGLTTADVTLNFKDQGFTCSDMQQGKIGVTWTCKQETPDHEYTVITFGDGPLEILFVQANALNYGSRDTNEVSSEFIGYVASLSFDGASPSEAKNWVQSNLGKNNVETKYGEVTFRLTGEQETRIRNLLIATDWAIKYGVEN